MPMKEVNGVDLHYHVQGKGTTIVFLHPPCIGSRVFTYLRNDLSQDHRTLLFDFRGHGRSGTSSAGITMPLLVEDTVRLMDSLDISSAYLCAYSAGAMVALEALLTHPDRFRGAALLSGFAQAEGWKTQAKLRLGGLAGRWRARDLLAVPILWANSDNSETFKRLRGETLAGDVNKWQEFLESSLHYSAVGRLSEIKQPMLLLAGERDGDFRQQMHTLQMGLPNVSSAYIPGVKHTLPTYAAGEIAPLLRGWLYAVEGTPEVPKTLERDNPDAWLFDEISDTEHPLHS